MLIDIQCTVDSGGMGDGQMVGTCSNSQICNTDGICYFCVNTADSMDTDPGCNKLNPHCQAEDGAGGTSCACTEAGDVCDESESSICTSHACKCGQDDEKCSTTTATPKCSEPGLVPQIPEKGSLTAKCQVTHCTLF